MTFIIDKPQISLNYFWRHRRPIMNVWIIKSRISLSRGFSHHRWYLNRSQRTIRCLRLIYNRKLKFFPLLFVLDRAIINFLRSNDSKGWSWLVVRSYNVVYGPIIIWWLVSCCQINWVLYFLVFRQLKTSELFSNWTVVLGILIIGAINFLNI